jgi:signal transduction histidine kinase
VNAPDFGRLRWRLLAANLAVATAGVAAVVAGVWLAAPRAFESAMGMRGGGWMMGGGAGMMDPLLRSAFGDAVGSALLLGFAAAAVVAVVAAVLVATWIAKPIDDLAAASDRVSRGDYSQPVPAAPGELGELAATFNAMAASLAANEQRRRDLIGDVAHELRTPIASVRGYVEGLAAGVFEPGPDAWRVLNEQTARLEHLVDDLALLWRAESRDLRLELEPVGLAGLISAVMDRHRHIATARSLTLSLGHLPDVTVVADRVRTAQVLDNLVGNALRYTPAGGRVEVDGRFAGPAVVVEIRDTGPGLTPDQAEHVFERFYRADPSRSRDGGGSGLGLAIARTLADAMGGSLVVASDGLGHGTTFALRLRLAPTTSASDTA